MRLIDIEPYEKDGLILQKKEEGKDCTVIKRTPLHAIPTVDAVPVVRCKDCKYCFVEWFVYEYNFCDKHEYIKGQPDNWFCADGESRELEGEHTKNDC